MTELQKGCFGESKGYYEPEPTTAQQALQNEGLLQSLLTVLIHTHRHREHKQCLTPGQTEKFFAQRNASSESPSCTAPCAACSKGGKCCNSPCCNHRAVVWGLVSSGSLLVLFAAANLGITWQAHFFYSQLYHITRTA